MMPTIAIMSPGDMGHAVAAVLRETGLRVISQLHGRSERTRWVDIERRRLDEMLQETLQHLLAHYVVTGAIDRAIQIALRLITIDPLQESVQRTLIRLYMYQDRVGSALDQYRRCRELLAR
jgi:DNA-binding SARP family transcriptional activator